MLMNDFKKVSEPQYAAGKQVKKGADLTGGLVVGRAGVHASGPAAATPTQGGTHACSICSTNPGREGGPTHKTKRRLEAGRGACNARDSSDAHATSQTLLCTQKSGVACSSIIRSTAGDIV